MVDMIATEYEAKCSALSVVVIERQRQSPGCRAVIDTRTTTHFN